MSGHEQRRNYWGGRGRHFENASFVGQFVRNVFERRKEYLTIATSRFVRNRRLQLHKPGYEVATLFRTTALPNVCACVSLVCL